MPSESDAFFGSKRLSCAVEFVGGRDVPPRMVSRATCVEAADLGARGHEPYQLRDLWTCFAAATGAPCGIGGGGGNVGLPEVVPDCDDALGC